MAKFIYTSIRWALTIFVLWHVWHNAHWSVALALTLISLSIEGIAAALSVQDRVITKHILGIQAIFNKAKPNDNEHPRS